jgi:hypothetical protein
MMSSTDIQGQLLTDLDIFFDVYSSSNRVSKIAKVRYDNYIVLKEIADKEQMTVNRLINYIIMLYINYYLINN